MITKEQEMVEKNKILEVRVGSHLYGTSTPESDEDFIGIFIPDIKYLAGLKRIEEVSFDKKSKNDSGKNTEDAIDRKFYTLDKFIRLCIDNNPNIIEILFVNKENLIYINDIGEELLSIAKAFPCKNAKHRFLGYSFSQKKKMIVKADNYTSLEQAADFIEKNKDKIQYLNEIEHHPLFQRYKRTAVRIGDISLPANMNAHTALKKLRDRISKFGKRKELYISKYGYDTKFAMHLIRLMLEGRELLSTGKILFPLQDKGFLLDIRYGKYKINEVLEFASKFENEIEQLYESGGVVPNKPNIKRVERFLIKIHKRMICNA